MKYVVYVVHIMKIVGSERVKWLAQLSEKWLEASGIWAYATGALYFQSTNWR